MYLLDALKQVDTSSLVDRVERNLLELLKDKQLKIGDSIPTELELTVSLGVSRTVIREALLRLRLMGLIETKKKKGTVITSPDIFAVLQKSMNPHILDEDTLKEVFEMRLVLEIGMADLLFQRISSTDIAELKVIAAEEVVVKGNPFFDLEQETAFHGKLYDITGNDTLRKFQKILLPVFHHAHQSDLLKPVPEHDHVVTHTDLVNVLENGSAELFRNAMRKHLECHFLRLF